MFGSLKAPLKKEREKYCSILNEKKYLFYDKSTKIYWLEANYSYLLIFQTMIK